MEDKRSMPTCALEHVNPLSNEHGRKDDESTLAEVRDDDPDGGDGLAEPHFVADEAAMVSCQVRVHLGDFVKVSCSSGPAGVEFMSNGPANSVLLVFECVESCVVSPDAEFLCSSIELSFDGDLL